MTGGHSLFVETDGKLAEVFAEEVEPGETRVAVPLRLAAPETVRELNLLELLAGREDVRVQGYDGLGRRSNGRGGAGRAASAWPSAAPVDGHRPPLTLAGSSACCRERCQPDPRADAVLLAPQQDAAGRAAADRRPRRVPRHVGGRRLLLRTGVRLAVHEDEADHFEALCRGCSAMSPATARRTAARASISSSTTTLLPIRHARTAWG